MTDTPDTLNTAARSSEATRAAALTMFADQIPCFFQLVDPSCPNLAAWMAYHVHEENTERATACGEIEPWPVCDEHRAVVQRANSPFWRVWFALKPTSCGHCHSPIRLDRIEALR